MKRASKRPRRDGVLAPLLLGLAAILVIAFAALYSLRSDAQHREAVGRELASITALKAEDLAAWREERVGNGLAVLGSKNMADAYARLLESPGDEAARETLVAWMRRAYSSYGYEQVYLLDPEGRTIASYPASGLPDQVIEAEARTYIRSDLPLFLDFYNDPIDKHVRLALMVPLGDSRNRGLFALRIDPEVYLYPYISRMPTISKSAESYLARSDPGDKVTFLSPLRLGPDVTLGGLPALGDPTKLIATKAALGQRGIVQGLDYRGVRALAAIASVEGSPWFLVSKMDLGEVDAASSERRLLLLLLVVALLIAEASGALAIARHGKLERLSREAEMAVTSSENEARLRKTLDTMIEACEILSFDWRILYVNDAAAVSSRREREALLGRTLQECFPGIERTPLFANLETCMSTREARTFETEYDFPEGGVAWFQMSVQPSAEGLFVLSLDITKRKRQELELRGLNAELERRVLERTTQLKASNEELESFAYSVAHDLRSPLRSIDGFARMLEEDYGPTIDEEGRRIIGVVRSSAQKMDALIRDLLEITRLGKKAVALETLDMRALAAEAFASCSDPATLAKFEFRLGQLPPAIADRSMMNRVWTNLLSNAVKYSAPAPRLLIEIEGSEKNGIATYSVRDHGVGFDQRFAPKLFGMFERLHDPETFQGSGVGLAIVRRIIERHGGSVRAESKVGEGAVFTFTLQGGRADER